MLTDGIYIFDCEVTAHDWLFVFKSVDTGEYTVIHNDNDAILAFMEREPFLGGFNNKHYDNHILKAVMCGADPETVKDINDWIIVDGINGWDIPLFREFRVKFDSFDLMDDTQQGTSLKGFEAHYGMPIRETEVDFDKPEKWTDDELDLMVRYCKHDVDATEELFRLRIPYLKNKVTLGEAKGYSARQSMYWTNAKLTSIYLGAKKPTEMWTDERDYHYPDKLLREYIPDEVFAFFDRLHDESIPNEDIFGSSLELTVGGCPVTVAYGGIHGAVPCYVEEETGIRKIRNKDVASYYPHLMTIPLDYDKKYGFCSRAIPDPETFVRTLEERVQAKRTGDKAKNQALKLVLNTTYGCMGNGQSRKQADGTYSYTAYNDLYDPLMCRSVCITGQLFLLELTCHLLAECPTLKVIQLNTDGIMVSFDECDEPAWQSITQEWQDRTGFELEEDFIHKIVQKDVNNYVEVPADGGKPKIKGGWLVRGIGEAGAFKINNDARIVAKAIVEWYVNGTPPEQTIGECNDTSEFQIISKVGGKYSGCFITTHEVIDIPGLGVTYPGNVTGTIPIQKVNRVYASKDISMGTIYKTHAVTKKDAKVGGLPDHCIIDNDNTLGIEVVDKTWYLDLAKKRIADFIGKEKKKDGRKIANLRRRCQKII